MQNYVTFDFDTLEKEAKKLQKQFEKNKLTVTDAVADTKATRASGFQTKAITIYFDDGQKVEIRVKKEGDIFQVKLNATVLPVSNVGNLNKAVAEIAKKIISNNPAWVKAQRRKQGRAKVSQDDIKPRPISRIKKIEETESEVMELESLKSELQQENTVLQQQDNERKTQVADLKNQLKERM